jgi:recombinational DNA repair protein RecT
MNAIPIADLLSTSHAREAIKPPAGTSLKRIIRSVEKYEHENPQLRLCTGQSIIDAVAKGVRWDLELGRHWYLIPTEVTVTRFLQPDVKEWRARASLDYKAKALLLRRHKIVVSPIRAACVFEKEHFVAKLGTAENHSVEHYVIASERHRGELVAVYVAAELARGRNYVIVRTKSDIERRRAENAQEKWQTQRLEEILWWAEKTLVHELWKWFEVDLPPELRDDEDAPRMIDGDAEDIGRAVPVEEEKALLTIAHHSIDPIAVMQEAQVA